MASPGFVFNPRNDVKKLLMYCAALYYDVRWYISNLDLNESAI